MIDSYLKLTAHVSRRMDRDDITAEDMEGIMSAALSKVMRKLNFHLSETTMDVLAPYEPTTKMPLPDGFYGMTALAVDGTRYTPATIAEVQAHRNQYAIAGSFIHLYPGTEKGKTLNFCYRSFLRGGEAGEGVSIDKLHELFRAYPDIDMRPRYDTGETLPETVDVHGRDGTIETDRIVGSLDHIDFYHNPVNRLIAQYPDVFMHAAFCEAYDHIEDFEASDRYLAKFMQASEEAMVDLLNNQYGSDKLTIKRVA